MRDLLVALVVLAVPLVPAVAVSAAPAPCDPAPGFHCGVGAGPCEARVDSPHTPPPGPDHPYEPTPAVAYRCSTADVPEPFVHCSPGFAGGTFCWVVIGPCDVQLYVPPSPTEGSPASPVPSATPSCRT